ncbi:zinc finger protein 862-like, partial [Anneissia japonica]|uniref:zinc finger protein 862-like n=1 Tax=Anneissia japonica TaxID=1529436 RepID=UPI0014255BD5
KSLGVDVLNSLKQGGNASYTSERFIQEAVTTLGKQISTPLLQKLRDSCYFSILVDETTNVAVKKELIIYIRYLKESERESETLFSGMLGLYDGKTETIVKAIIDHLHSNDLPKNMCALGSDGAAVMVGSRNGVAAKLKEQVPRLLNNHCVAHRLALASSQAANHIPYLKKFKAIVEQLYRFYNYSPVRTASLHEIQRRDLDYTVVKPLVAATISTVSALKTTLVNISLSYLK